MRSRILAAVLVVWAGAAQADGRLEINQASVLAAGGFPYTIGQSGSYVLTSDLVVPAATSGLIITANDVTIDLNGFRVVGPSTCLPGACTSGSADGIVTSGAHSATARNGQVSGFPDRCIDFGKYARVVDLRIFDCRFGVLVGSDGIVMRNVVHNIGDTGIQSGPGSVFAHNTVSDTDLRNPGGSPAVQGGSATAGNLCDDGTCSARPARRYYLTKNTYTGAQAGTACAAGFHIPNLLEVLQTSALQYDTKLGQQGAGGNAPPGQVPGWAYVDSGGTCSGWSSTSGLGGVIEIDLFLSGGHVEPWQINEFACSLSPRVWCVED